MTNRKLSLIAIFFALIVIAAWGFTTNKATTPTQGHSPTVTPLETPVLVELFTSQGCSSCPPADQVLQQLEESAQAEQLPVITLSYHVDYWNRLGWTDPYSQAIFSTRQREYAAVLDGRVYTPQMVINGQSGHVGSREREVRAAISVAARQQAITSITHEVHPQSESGNFELTYHLSGRTNGVLLHFALVETNVGNHVPKGENRGHHLNHINVVRELLTAPVKDIRGSLNFSTKSLDNQANGKGVLFVQDEQTLQVLGTVQVNWN